MAYFYKYLIIVKRWVSAEYALWITLELCGVCRTNQLSLWASAWYICRAECTARNTTMIDEVIHHCLWVSSQICPQRIGGIIQMRDGKPAEGEYHSHSADHLKGV